jgi:(1->4)-alpha-D-glucan 1-alpha-D-glucosylmutase
MKLQQFSGPVHAKGVEDTAFYRYHALVAANDVGGHPGRLGVAPAEFHDTCLARLDRFPYELNATATHDSKRGEDARVRLAVLSEMPDEWRRAVSEWMRLNGRHRTRLASIWAPDRNDEYLFYQALAGVWPAERPETPVPAEAPADLVGRLDDYMQKAVREAKVHTSWIDRDLGYARAVSAFVRKTLTDRTAARFLASFVPVARRIAPAGASNALAQLVLKIAAPGVSDFYQGTEFWDLNLVDPDNRRPVDFHARIRALEALEPLLTAAAEGRPDVEAVARLTGDWVTGHVKLFVMVAGLRCRRDHAGLFQHGRYTPLTAEGTAAEQIVAFARDDASGVLLAIAPRLVLPFTTGGRLPSGSVWAGTHVPVPAPLARRTWRQVITGDDVPADAQGRVALDAVLAHLPVALLWSGAPVSPAS